MQDIACLFLTSEDYRRTYGFELDFLVKRATSPSLKDIESRWAKEQALKGTLSLARDLDGDGSYNVLFLDDLFDTGASLARRARCCASLRK